MGLIHVKFASENGKILSYCSTSYWVASVVKTYDKIARMCPSFEQ